MAFLWFREYHSLMNGRILISYLSLWSTSDFRAFQGSRVFGSGTKYAWHTYTYIQVYLTFAVYCTAWNSLRSGNHSNFPTFGHREIQAIRKKYEAIAHTEIEGGSVSLLEECIVCIPLQSAPLKENTSTSRFKKEDWSATSELRCVCWIIYWDFVTAHALHGFLLKKAATAV